MPWCCTYGISTVRSQVNFKGVFAQTLHQNRSLYDINIQISTGKHKLFFYINTKQREKKTKALKFAVWRIYLLYASMNHDY